MKLNLKNLKRARACSDAIEWYRKHYRRGARWLWSHIPADWLNWAICRDFEIPRDILIPYIERVVDQSPWVAFKRASLRVLPQSMLNSLAKKYPHLALKHAWERLSPEMRELCLNNIPIADVALFTVWDKLPLPQLIKLARKAPGAALQYASERLPDWLLLELAPKDPKAAIDGAAERLPLDFILQHARTFPGLVLYTAGHRLSDDVLQELAALAPLDVLGIPSAAARLPKDVLYEYARRFPLAALHQIADILPEDIIRELEERVEEA